MEFSVVPLFLCFVGLAALIIASAGPGASETHLFDPKRIQKKLLSEPSLSDEERAYLAELAVLELPRRHLIC